MRKTTPVFGRNRKPAYPCAIPLKSQTDLQHKYANCNRQTLFLASFCNKFPVTGDKALRRLVSQDCVRHETVIPDADKPEDADEADDGTAFDFRELLKARTIRRSRATVHARGASFLLMTGAPHPALQLRSLSLPAARRTRTAMSSQASAEPLRASTRAQASHLHDRTSSPSPFRSTQSSPHRFRTDPGAPSATRKSP